MEATLKVYSKYDEGALVSRDPVIYFDVRAPLGLGRAYRLG